MTSPALLNFLAGTSAATATALLAAIPAGHEHGTRVVNLIGSAIPWFVIAVIFARAATVCESARREADLFVTANLTRTERADVYSARDRRIRKLVALSWFAALAWSLVAAIILVVLFD